MIKTLTNKVKVVILLALLMVISVIVAMFSFAKADTPIEGLWEVKTLKMEDARLLVEGEDGVNGLQFVASMSAEEFEGFLALVGEGKEYLSYTTNLFILPETYIEGLGGIPGYDSVDFEGTFDWAEWNGTEYVYTESEKIRIININANDWVLEGDKYVYTGAIVDVLEQNETTKFRAWAYIEAFGNDSFYHSVYTFSDKLATDEGAFEISSIPEQIAEEFTSLSNEQKEWVLNNWVSVSMVEDTTEYLIDVKDQKTFDLLDAVKDQDAIDHLNSFTGMPFTIKATDVNGNVKTDRFLDVTESDSLRLWDLEISLGEDMVYKGKVDLYNSTESAVWNDVSADAIAMNSSGFKTKGISTETFDGKKTIKVDNFRPQNVPILDIVASPDLYCIGGNFSSFDSKLTKKQMRDKTVNQVKAYMNTNIPTCQATATQVANAMLRILDKNADARKALLQDNDPLAYSLYFQKIADDMMRELGLPGVVPWVSFVNSWDILPNAPKNLLGISGGGQEPYIIINLKNQKQRAQLLMKKAESLVGRMTLFLFLMGKIKLWPILMMKNVSNFGVMKVI